MGDQPMVDTAEVVHISSLALLKMLKHGRAGVPMEVMGLMLGMQTTGLTLVPEYEVLMQRSQVNLTCFTYV